MALLELTLASLVDPARVALPLLAGDLADDTREKQDPQDAQGARAARPDQLLPPELTCCRPPGGTANRSRVSVTRTASYR